MGRPETWICKALHCHNYAAPPPGQLSKAEEGGGRRLVHVEISKGCVSHLVILLVTRGH